MNDGLKHRLGQVAYEHYVDARHGLAYDGTRIPAWNEVDAEIREAWAAASLRVARMAVNDAAMAAELGAVGAIERMLAIAREDVGRTDADTFRVGRGGGNWCAYWLSRVLERAGLPTPKPNERARRGARALTRWVAKHGQWVVDPPYAALLCSVDQPADWLTAAKYCRPGDVIAWRATRIPGDWWGHVALIVDVDRDAGTIVTIGGNEGGAVRETELDADQWPWRRRGGLYGVAQLHRSE